MKYSRINLLHVLQLKLTDSSLYIIEIICIFIIFLHTHTHSPFPEGKYDFSTLWGIYVSGDTEKIRVRHTLYDPIQHR